MPARVRGVSGQRFCRRQQLFLQWSQGIASRGPGGFYGGDPSANYPPVSIYLFWGVHGLAPLAGSALSTTTAQAMLVLLKLPAVLADVGVAVVAYVLAKDLHGPRSGLVAAALYCLAPPVWYTSALWGQIDSVLTFFSLLALALLVRGHSELAAVAAVCALLVKPQGVIVVLIVGVALLVRHLPRDPERRRGTSRLLTSVLAAVVSGLVLIVPFDYEALAPPAWAGVWGLGDLAGLLVQSVATSQLFPVLSANAYNLWALAGDPPLVDSITTGTAVWTPDAFPVWGVAAGVVGAVLLGLVVVVVVVGLVLRRDRAAVVFAHLLLSYSLYLLPTRSHERYLLPAFASGAVLAAPHLLRWAAYLGAAALNVVNLHAVLAGPVHVVQPFIAQAPRRGPRPSTGAGPAPVDPTSGGRPADISLPLGDLARAEWVAVTVCLTQTAILVALLLTWLVSVSRALKR